VTATPPRADLVREGERIRAEIAAHPRAVLIDALADTMHAIEDDMGTGRHINDYLCLAYATVEMLPSLVYDENATCDEPGCGAHPATQVTAIGDAAAAPPAPEQVFVDAAEVYDTTRSAVMRLPVEPPLAEWEREVLAHQDALRAAVASAYRAGQAATPDDVESLPPFGRLVGRGPLKIRQAATPDGPRRWALRFRPSPGPMCSPCRSWKRANAGNAGTRRISPTGGHGDPLAPGVVPTVVRYCAAAPSPTPRRPPTGRTETTRTDLRQQDARRTASRRSSRGAELDGLGGMGEL
jgi:hypothetical protein